MAQRLLEAKDAAGARELMDAYLAESPNDHKAWCILGEAHYQLHEDAEAMECFQKALHLKHEFSWAHYGLSKVLYERQDFEAANKHALFAHFRNRRNPQFAAQVGLCNLGLGNYRSAFKVLKVAVQRDPSQPKVLNNLAIASRALGHVDDAKSYFRRAIAVDPTLELAYQNLVQLCIETDELEQAQLYQQALDQLAEQKQIGNSGNAAHDAVSGGDHLAHGNLIPASPLTQLQEEIRQAELAFAASPDKPEVALHLCKLLKETGDFEEAASVVEVALASSPDMLELVAEKAALQAKLGDFKEAIRGFEKALEIAPDVAEYYQEISQCYSNLEKYEEALTAIRKAYALDGGLRIHGEYAKCLVNACQYEEALAHYTDILESNPEVILSVAANLGILLTYLGRFEEAREKLDLILSREPNNGDLRFFSAMIHLLHGEYEQGWKEYAIRFNSDHKQLRLLPYPLWNKEPLEGKRILILAEQGLGDQVMFASCLNELHALQPAAMFLECHERLEKTFARSFPFCRIIATQQEAKFDWIKSIAPLDYYLPIADLARHFRSDPQDFQRYRPYLSADPARIEFWRQRLAAYNHKPKIGISWRGGLQKTRRAVRSLDLTRLAPLLSLGDYQFVNLQYGQVSEEITEGEQQHGFSVLNWPEAIQDLDEFAALIGALDLVITVCNTTVHFSGALNKPVWVMAPRIPEWRYGLQGERMDWYPAARMFRQAKDGDWEEVIDAVKAALARAPWRESCFNDPAE